MNLWLHGVVAAFALVGCTAQYDDKPLPKPDLRRAVTVEDKGPAAPPKRLRDRERASGATSGSLPPAVADTQQLSSAAADNAQPAERDLPEELRTLIGNPTSCFASRTAGAQPLSLTIAVEATVSPSGRVTRAAARSSGLSATELDCITARIENVRFAAPIEGAPKTISASLELRENTPAKPATPAPPG